MIQLNEDAESLFNIVMKQTRQGHMSFVTLVACVYHLARLCGQKPHIIECKTFTEERYFNEDNQ